MIGVAHAEDSGSLTKRVRETFLFNAEAAEGAEVFWKKNLCELSGLSVSFSPTALR